MAESRHVMLDYDKVLSSKKELLISQLSGIHMVKHIRDYRALKTRENDLRNKIKTEILALKDKFKSLESNLPQDLIKKEVEKTQTEKKNKVQNPDSDLQRQLAEIRYKLSKLGKVS